MGKRGGRQGCGRNQEKSKRKGEAELHIEEKKREKFRIIR